MRQGRISITLDSLNSFSSFPSLNKQKFTIDVRPSNIDDRNTDLSISQQFGGKYKRGRGILKNNEKQIEIHKRKLIQKDFKNRRKQVKQQKQQFRKKQQQQVTLRYFRRKIFPQVRYYQKVILFRITLTFSLLFSKLQNFIQQRKTQKEALFIYDWLMQGASVLYLSKDAFYMTISIIKIIFESTFLKNSSQRVVQAYSAATLSIIAKLENGLINFPQALSKITCKRIDKDAIIQAEVSIMKKLQFKLPFKALVFEELISICCQWHQFITFKKQSQLIDYQSLELGQSSNIKDWNPSSQQKFKQISYVFDGIMLYCNQIKIDKNNLLKPITFSLFTILNTRTNQFFPIKPRDKSQLILLFHDFLVQCYDFKRQQMFTWMCDLINIRGRINLVENSHKICSASKIRENKMIDEKEEQYFRQAYRNILSWV